MNSNKQNLRKVHLLALLVGFNGLAIVFGSLVDQFSLRHGFKLEPIVVDIPVIVGVTLIYLASLLRRQKQTAWVVATIVYAFYLGISLTALIASYDDNLLTLIEVVRRIGLPSVVLLLLVNARELFIVKSDPTSYRSALKISAIVLLIAFLYGSLGFILMDKSDFKQEITLGESIHYTVDQFDLTTANPLHPHSVRARVFEDSLSLISTLAIGFVIISLFQPIRLSLSGDEDDRTKAKLILNSSSSPSEDFFKIWPKDKHYFFHHSGKSFVAYHVNRGVALCLGDPVGQKNTFDELIIEFKHLCFNNDWQPAFVHINRRTKKILSANGFSFQKLGQEAVVDINKFNEKIIKTKYFRQINNRFSKKLYTPELLSPPHSDDLINRLKEISDQWLERGSRSERGFAMGYFEKNYLQMCEIIIIRDSAATIQAFANILPAKFDTTEATYDLLRYSDSAMGNINDYLLIELMNILKERSYIRLNLGFCPLVGLDEVETDKKSLIDSVLKFAYANGDRFYSFKGLYKFKNKYEPVWDDRYLAYTKGLPGFSKAISAVISTMKVDPK